MHIDAGSLYKTLNLKSYKGHGPKWFYQRHRKWTNLIGKYLCGDDLLSYGNRSLAEVSFTLA